MAKRNHVPKTPPVFAITPSPAGPPPAPHIFVTGVGPRPQDQGPANDVTAPLPTKPATITDSWRTFATALGQTAPADWKRARRAIDAIRGAGG